MCSNQGKPELDTHDENWAHNQGKPALDTHDEKCTAGR